MLQVGDRVTRRYGKLTHIVGTVGRVASTSVLVTWQGKLPKWHVAKSLKKVEDK